MKIAKPVFIVLALAAMSLSLAACGPGIAAHAQAGDDTAAQAQVEVAPVSQPAVVESVAADAQVASPLSPASSAELQTGTAQQSQLTVVQGDVYLKRVDEFDFSLVTDSPLTLNEGDTVRTDRNAQALITLSDNNDITVFETSQVEIATFRKQGDGKVLVQLRQFVGKLFHRVNFAVSGSNYEVYMPQSVAAVRGTSFTTTVKWGNFNGDFTNPTFKIVFNLPFDQFLLRMPVPCNLTIIVEVTDGTVEFTYTDLDGVDHTMDINPGEFVTVIFGVCGPAVPAGAAPGPTPGPVYGPGEVTGGVTVHKKPANKCGDGVCDPYSGENSRTCPADCP